jgi:hypothetical protein
MLLGGNGLQASQHGSNQGGENSTAFGVAVQAQAVVNSALTYWGVSGSMALEAAGTGYDLYRAQYDVYAIDKDTGWRVLPGFVDAHALNATQQASAVSARSPSAVRAKA